MQDSLPNEHQTATTRAPFVFESDGLQIFGVIHRPAGVSAVRRVGVAIFHGFVGSKDQPHRIFVTLAERLARAGLVALRIDFPGRGDSEGESVDITVDGDMTAAKGAIDALAAQPDVDPERIGLVGMSWGGAIAACLAGRDRRVTSTALWSSPPDELDWRPTFHVVDGREVQDVWGNLVGRQFYTGLHRIRPIDEITGARGPILIAYGTEDEVVPVETVRRAEQVLASAGIAYEIVAIEGADHAFMRYAWERELIDHTVNWLGTTLAARST